MLIPCGSSERLPCRLRFRVISARDLPIMDKSASSTDAFVEVFFSGHVFKTDICSHSLDPVWNSEMFVVETDEQQLVEHSLQFRVMDYDTYSANDAIGRVYVDVYPLLAKIRFSSVSSASLSGWLPICDTIYGIRGQLSLHVELELLVHAQLSSYVLLLSGDTVPNQLTLVEMEGLITEFQSVSDPEYEWLDKIRTPRATNLARQSLIKRTIFDVQRRLALKAWNAGCNAVLGLHLQIDLEGDGSDQLTVRAFGTAVTTRLGHGHGHGQGKTSFDGEFNLNRLILPIVTLNSLPFTTVDGMGAVISARTIGLVDVDEEERRRSWASLRQELIIQMQQLGANMVLGYTEQVSVQGALVLLNCCGTAVRVNCSSSSTSDCAQFHVAYDENNLPFTVKLSECTICKNGPCPDFLMSTLPLPSTEMYTGQKTTIQVAVSKKFSGSAEDDDAAATELSTMLPFVEHELHSELLMEQRQQASTTNALFELRISFCLTEVAMVAIASAVACRLKALGTEQQDIGVLQRVTDARRFSWGSMRDAMRFNRPQQQQQQQQQHQQQAIINVPSPLLQLRPLQWKHQRHPPSPDSSDRILHSRLTRLVGRIRGQRLHHRSGIERERECGIAQRQLASQCGIFTRSSIAVSQLSTIAGFHLNDGCHDNGFVFTDHLPSSSSYDIGVQMSTVLIRECSMSQRNGIDGPVEEVVSDGLSEAMTMTRSISSSLGADCLAWTRVCLAQISGGKDQAQLVFVLSGDMVMTSPSL